MTILFVINMISSNNPSIDIWFNLDKSINFKNHMTEVSQKVSNQLYF